ncbi:MAG: GldG family protein [Acidobacteriota bacterium]
MTTRDSKGTIFKTGMQSASLLLLVALLAIVNYFGWKYHQRFDWTATEIYSLSDKTKNVLANLEQDVEAVVFLNPVDPLFDSVEELLARYEAASSRFSVRTVDAARNPLEAQTLAERFDLQSDAIVLVRGDDRKIVLRDDLAEYDYSGVQMGRTAEISAFKGEQRFTSALIDLEEQVSPKVLFTTGHGEIVGGEIAGGGLSALRRLLQDDNFEIEEWASLGQETVPEGTDLLVIAGPTSGFIPPETAMFSSYLEAGGRILLLLDPVLSPTGSGELLDIGLEEWLAGWSVEVGRNAVVDPAAALPFYGAETLFVADYGTHPLTRSVQDGGLAVLVSMARSVGAGESQEGLRVTQLLETSREGWGETDLLNVEKGAGDLAGPVPLGVVVEIEADDSPADSGLDAGGEAVTGDGEGDELAAAAASGGRLVVFGDSDFVGDGLLQARDANVVLLIDTLNWLVERETLLGIPPKEPERVRLSMTGSQLAWTNALALLVLPGLGIIFGVLVYRRRRR